MKDTIILISAIIFTLYPFVFAWVFGGSEYSISNTYRILEQHAGNYKAIFVLWLWVFLIPLVFIAPNPWYICAILVEAFIGASPAFYKHKLENAVHLFGSFGGVVLGVIGACVLMSAWWYALIVAVVFLLIFLTMKHYIWWIEIAAYYFIVIPLLIL